MMRRFFNLICVGGLALTTMGGCARAPAPANPAPQPGPGGEKKGGAAELAAKALTASDASQRIEAAIELSMLRDADALPQLRRLAAESKDAEVLVHALNGLMARNDVDSLEIFIANIDHKSSPVSEAAYLGARRLTGITIDDLGMLPDDLLERHAAASRRLKEMVKIGKAKQAP